MAETLLSLRDLLVRYGATTALDIASLDVQCGEVLAIVGANGAGKSTLLRVIALLQSADRGLVEFAGLAAIQRNPLALRRRIATVFQQPLLIDDSVYGNVSLGLRLRGVAKAEIEKRVMPWLERIGIRDLAYHPARTLSGGEAQRVSLARALVLDPDLLLLDEPFSALDQPSREALLRDFHRSVKGLGVTVILVTHDRHEAFALAERVAVLDRGRILQLGSREEVFYRPVNEVAAAVVGIENRLAGIVEVSNRGISRVSVGGQSVEVSGSYAVGAKVILCFRANDVQIVAGALSHLRPIRFEGKIREVFRAHAGDQIAVDCTGFSLIGSAASARCQSTELREGCAITASLELNAIHVILPENSR